MNSIPLGSRTIENFGDVLVIAEIGVNHDGSLARALQLVELAADCGADAVKLQLFRASSLMNRSSSFAQYQKSQCAEDDPIQMLKRYEMHPVEICQIVSAIRQRGMLPIATPFSLSDVEIAAGLDLAAVKIASPDLVNRPLLDRASSLYRPLLISTGAATLEEVELCTQWLAEMPVPFVLMHCTSSYPTPAEYANLSWIAELATRFNTLVGFSDHTTDVVSGALAVTAGACIIERHLTYDRAAQGPDHAASSDAREFAQYVQHIRTAAKSRGKPGKSILPIEEDVRRVSRQSLVAQRTLNAGEVLSDDDLTIQRPGTGIPAAMLKIAVGRRAARPIPAGTLLHWDMLTDAA
jgi:N,N'-diacetyllegionaminate synthase